MQTSERPLVSLQSNAHRARRTSLASILPLAFIMLLASSASASQAASSFPHETHIVEASQGARTETLWRIPFAEMPRITRFFEQPENRYAKGHRGIDFNAGEGTPILAPAAGTIHFSGVVAEKPAVSVRLDNIIYTFEPATSHLSAGDTVTEGQQFATVAVGGHCDGSCVHFGVRVSGTYVNPLRFFAGRPVLLALH